MGQLTAEQLNSVARVRANIAKAVDLVDDVVLLVRARAGQLPVKPAPIEVGVWLKELAEQWRPEAEKAGLTLFAVCTGEITIVSDSERLRQIADRLVDNAIRYNRPGGKVEITSRKDTQGVQIAVLDTGVGIPEDKVPLVFTEFEKIDPQAKSGSGLGLAICRHVAGLLGGDIQVATERGTGSTFTVVLPHDLATG